jgi:hypothetical protein
VICTLSAESPNPLSRRLPDKVLLNPILSASREGVQVGGANYGEETSQGK